MKGVLTTRARFTLAFLLVVALSAAAQVGRVTGVETVGFTVADADRSSAFYVRALDFAKVSDDTKSVNGSRVRVVRMQLGEEQIELTQYLNAPGKPFPADSRGNDRWFQHVAIITRDMDKAYARLRENHVRHASNAPQTLPAWNKNAANIKAFYFRDPDGHFLEVLQFPADKGLAKWHRNGNDLFMGIDHTAIVVADTDESLRLYRDQLGMKVAGESDNYGVEQEHLNGVFGAHLRITALRAESGPGIELLEYLSPLDGRPYPMEARANDLVHWETRLAASMERNVTEHAETDPDGHVLLFHEAAIATMNQARQGGK